MDAELTPEGAKMAEAFAKAYRSIPWTAAYVSPTKRTIATAKPLCEAVGLEMQLRDGLKEIRYGKWEDKTMDFVKEHYWDDYIHWLAQPAWNPPTGGENVGGDFQSRINYNNSDPAKVCDRQCFSGCLTSVLLSDHEVICAQACGESAPA